MPARIRFLPTLALTLILLTGGDYAAAQLGDDLSGFAPPGGLGGLDFGGVGETKVTAEFQVEKGSREGRLAVTAVVPEGAHIYSMTLPKKGVTGLPTTIKPESGSPLELTGPFQPDRDPQLVEQPGDTAKAEEFKGKITWTAPMRFAEGVNPETASFKVKFNGQVCANACTQVEKTLTAKFAGYYEPVVPSGEYRDGSSHVTIRGHVEPKTAAPGDTVKLVLTARPDAGFHVFAWAPKDPHTGSKPTVIAVTKSSGLSANQPPEASAEPLEKATGLDEEPVARWYEKPITWTIDVKVPADAKPGDYPIAGAIGYATCSSKGCDPPNGAHFEGVVKVAKASEAGKTPLAFSAASYASVAKSAAQWSAKFPEPAKPLDAATLGLYVLFGLLGGLILNLMPCVLPVIGLKVLSFAEQGGQHRIQILNLNLWYSIGIVAVFMVLATIAAFLNLGWGEQFTFLWFKVGLIGLVFAMALSFLGVWEIPIPGFVGGSRASALQSQEGMSGAFFKGVFTTVLATPCSGPFLGPVFGFTLSQPAYVTYILFASVGVGMSSPYLVLGLFPGLMRFMPKPGAWMETFKQLLGFLLLATVVYLFSTLSSDYYIPTLTLVVGLWFGCWLIGRLPGTAETGQKMRRWAYAVAVTLLAGLIGFKALGPSEHDLPWQPFSPAALAAARQEGKTVVVDFTASWCPTCKVNLKFAINTPAVHQLVEENNVVPLLADWSDRNEQLKQKLAELNSKSIPVFAVYPAGKPESEVIVLRDLLTESQILDAIKQAGPSKAKAPETATAMNN